MKIAAIIRTTKTQVVVRCPYCWKEHFHGLASIGGHVVAHCIDVGPGCGYEIPENDKNL